MTGPVREPRPPRPHRDSLEAQLDSEGRVMRWPTRSAARDAVLDHLAAQLEPGREYTESELNILLLEHHTFNDAAVLRRSLYDSGRITRERDGSRYRRPPAG